MNITIRDVNPQYWKELKIEAVREGITVGQALNIALDKWLSSYKNKKEEKKKRSFWDMKPLEFEGQNSTQFSRTVDEVLYGRKK